MKLRQRKRKFSHGKHMFILNNGMILAKAYTTPNLWRRFVLNPWLIFKRPKKVIKL